MIKLNQYIFEYDQLFFFKITQRSVRVVIDITISVRPFFFQKNTNKPNLTKSFAHLTQTIRLDPKWSKPSAVFTLECVGIIEFSLHT